MTTIVLNGKDDFIRKCKEFGVFSAYINIEAYESKEETGEILTTIARLTAVAPAFNGCILLSNVTTIEKIMKADQLARVEEYKKNGDPITLFMAELQEKAGDKLAFCSGVAMI